MNRIVFLIVLSIGSIGIAWSQPSDVMYIAPDGDCDNDPCTSATSLLCRESGTSTDIYICNTATGFYVPAGTFGSAIDLSSAETSGMLPVSKGGTGLSSEPGSRVLVTNPVGTQITTDADLTYNSGLNILTAARITATTGVVEPNKRTVEICASGCEYATLGAACAAETSTCADPIVFQVHGVYSSSSTTSCAGQQCFAIVGDGPGVTKIENTTVGSGSGLSLGSSRNGIVKGMTLVGYSALLWDGGGAGVGTSFLTDLDVSSIIGATGDEEGIRIENAVPGSKLTIARVRSQSRGQGIGIHNSPDLDLLSYNNRLIGTGGAGVTAQLLVGFGFWAIPCSFISVGDVVELSGSVNSSQNAYIGYYFRGPDSASCASGSAKVFSPTITITNGSPNGTGASARGVYVETTATELASLDVHDPHIVTSTPVDTSNGASWGVIIKNAATDAKVTGGYVRSTGGAGASSTATITASPCDGTIRVKVGGVMLDGADPGSICMAPLDARYFNSTGLAIFNGKVIVGATPAAPSGTGLQILSNAHGTTLITEDNINETANQTSPVRRVCNSTAAAGEDCFISYVDEFGSFNIDYGTLGASKLRMRTASDMLETRYSRFAVSAAGAYAELGDASSNGDVGLWARTGSNPGKWSWNQGTLAWVGDVADKIRLGGVGTGATLANSGEITIDTSANQLAYYSGSGVRVLDPVRTACYTQRGVAATDDHFVFWIADRPVTVTGVGCRCVGNCGTPATFTLEDNDGNAMTIAGTSPICSKGTTETAFSAVTVGNGLIEGEGLAFDVTNTPSLSTDAYTICVRYTVDRQ